MIKFTLDEISKHNKPNDMWIILKDCVYDISNFKHPGGDIIKGVVGQDATSIFITTHQNDLKIFDNIKKGLFKGIKFVGKIHKKDVNKNIFDKNY